MKGETVFLQKLVIVPNKLNNPNDKTNKAWGQGKTLPSWHNCMAWFHFHSTLKVCSTNTSCSCRSHLTILFILCLVSRIDLLSFSLAFWCFTFPVHHFHTMCWQVLSCWKQSWHVTAFIAQQAMKALPHWQVQATWCNCLYCGFYNDSNVLSCFSLLSIYQFLVYSLIMIVLSLMMYMTLNRHFLASTHCEYHSLPLSLWNVMDLDSLVLQIHK